MPALAEGRECGDIDGNSGLCNKAILADIKDLAVPMHDQPGIAIVVSTHQRPEHLRRCLLSIGLQQGVNASLEVVVVDDGSTDHTPQVVAEFAKTVEFPVRFMTHPNQGFRLAYCRNEGIRASREPYVLFTDGDCVMPPDHVAQHLRCRRHGYAVAGDSFRLDQASSERVNEATLRSGEFVKWVNRAEAFRLYKSALKAWWHTCIRHPNRPRLVGNNMGVWRRDLETVNGFDEKFVGWGCEDDDLTFRLREAGIRIKSILPWTRLYHLWHPVHPSAPKRKWKDGPNVAYLHRPHRLTHCLDGLIKHTAKDRSRGVAGSPATGRS